MASFSIATLFSNLFLVDMNNNDVNNNDHFIAVSGSAVDQSNLLRDFQIAFTKLDRIYEGK